MDEKDMSSQLDKAVSGSAPASTSTLPLTSEANDSNWLKTIKLMGTDTLVYQGPPTPVLRSERRQLPHCAVTIETRKQALDAFTSLLQRDRMIDLEIGSGADQVQFYVPERSLSGISPAFAAILETKVEADNQGRFVLRLPDDNPEAWKILLYAQYAHSLPAMYLDAFYFDIELAKHLALLVECWLLGDKYGALQFQDRIMAELIKGMCRNRAHPVPIAHAALHARPDSKLFHFMAEEEAGRLQEDVENCGEHTTVSEDFGREDIPQAFVDAVAAVDLNSVVVWRKRLSSRSECLRLTVDGGPDKSWLHVPLPFCDSHEPPELDNENVEEQHNDEWAEDDDDEEDEEDEDDDDWDEAKEHEEEKLPSSGRQTFLGKFCDLFSVRSK